MAKIAEVHGVGKLDLESFIHDHFVNLGYKVIRGSHYDPTFELQGAPDFYVVKDGHGFFVEVKSWDNSLSLKQIAWMLVHSDHEFKLAVVPQGFFDVHPWREGQNSGGRSFTVREISIEREKSKSTRGTCKHASPIKSYESARMV